MLKVLVRKIVSLVILSYRLFFSLTRVALAKISNQDASIPWSTRIEAGASLRTTDGGRLFLGEGVSIGASTQILAKRGAIEVGNNGHIGPGSVVVSQDKISIGADALIGEHVSVRDQNHALLSRPYRQAGFETSPIVIGENVWIVCKSTLLGGAKVGANTVIGANSVVNSTLPDSVVAVGAPASVIRTLDFSS